MAMVSAKIADILCIILLHLVALLIKPGTVCPFKVPERSKFSLTIYDHFKALNVLDHSSLYHQYTLEICCERI